MTRARHVECKPGAAVRLHGYMPARVVTIEREYNGPHWDTATLYAHCRVTVRSAGIGPHGYRPGELVRVRAGDAVPRDLIRVRRGSGRLYWPTFTVRT